MAPASNSKRTGKWMRRVSRVGEGLYSNRRRIATVAVAILTVLVGYHVVFGRDGLTAFRNKQHDLHDLKRETVSLQRENGQLQGHVDRLTSDPNAIEHQAREDLHYTRPGEVIVTLPSNDNGKH
ncbi:FtsB family cell division protein [Terriglobus sp.]|uniref:FtsB family cell division protein n=1 Tax=Terriglobus sp. TaxID=1889013 RepID=UPI003B00E5DA